MPQAAQRPRIEGREISTRSYSRAPQSVDVATRTFGMIASTETPVRTHILDPRTDVYVEADEVLKSDGLDLSRAAGMPLVDTHNTWGSITNILGRVFNVRVEDGVVVADAQLNSRNADLITDIAEGHYAQVSVGYTVDPADYEIQDRPGNVPLAVATRWRLDEVSLVPLGADPNASVRSRGGRNQNKRENAMDDLEKLIDAAEEALVAVEEAVEAAGDEIDDALAERARKLRAADDEEKDDERKRGKREGKDETEEERKKREAEEDEEKEEVRSLRSVAREYGPEASKLVADLVKIRSGSAAIRSALGAFIAARASAGVTSAVEPQKARASSDVIDTRSIYERRNGRSL